MNLLEIILLIILAIVALIAIVRLPGSVEYNNEETLNIAKYQRAILWLIVVNIFTLWIRLAPIFTIIAIVLICVGVVLIYRLATALKSSPAWLYAVLFIVPFIGLIALLILNGRATRVLRAHGIRVGVMGANRSDLNKLAVNDK